MNGEGTPRLTGGPGVNLMRPRMTRLASWFQEEADVTKGLGA